MRKWQSFVSPWSVAALALWIVVLLLVANWALPVFANADCGALEGGARIPCTRTTVEWVPSLLTGASVATLVVVGVLLAIRVLPPRQH